MAGFDFFVQPQLLDLNGDHCLIIGIQMPAATELLDCRNVYLCSSKKSRKALYLTAERNEEGTYFLCAWTKDGTHLNFGESRTKGEFNRVIGLFKELIIDGGLDAILHSIA